MDTDWVLTVGPGAAACRREGFVWQGCRAACQLAFSWGTTCALCNKARSTEDGWAAAARDAAGPCWCALMHNMCSVQLLKAT